MLTPRRPGNISLVDLINMGFLSDIDVDCNGRVAENTRVRAERQYAEFMGERARMGYTPPNNHTPPTLQHRHSRPPPTRPARRPQHAVRETQHVQENAHRGHPMRIPQRPAVRSHTPSPPVGPPSPPRNETELRPQDDLCSTLHRKCYICFSGARDHAINPCFHMCVCVTCAARLTQCPMCRATIRSVHRIYT